MSYVLLSFCTKLGLQLISVFCKPILGIDRSACPILSPCLRGTSDESNDVAEGVTVGAGSACPSNAACHSDDRNNLIFSRFLSTAVLTLNTLDLCSFASLSPCPF